MRLEHAAFNVKDVKEFAAWYAENLDMVIVRSFNEAPFIHFLADSAGKSMIEVYSNPLGEFVPYSEYHPVTFHLAFAVDDMEAASQRLVAAGAPWTVMSIRHRLATSWHSCAIPGAIRFNSYSE